MHFPFKKGGGCGFTLKLPGTPESLEGEKWRYMAAKVYPEIRVRIVNLLPDLNSSGVARGEVTPNARREYRDIDPVRCG